MKRTKFKKDFVAKGTAWLTTASHLGHHFPWCSDLIDAFPDYWTGKNEAYIIEYRDYKMIQKQIKNVVMAAIDRMEDWEIEHTANHVIDPRAKNHLRQILPAAYRGYFETKNGQFPLLLSKVMPFARANTRSGVVRTKFNPINRNLPNGTEIKLYGPMALLEDIKTCVAINQIRKRSYVAKLDHVLVWKTTIPDLARELRKNQPNHPHTKTAVKESLMRLASVRIYIKKPFFVGGLIDSMVEDKNDSDLIHIAQNKYFAELMFRQYNGIPFEILDNWYRLPASAAILYYWLNGQQSFNKGGWWSSAKAGTDLIGVYDMAGMQNPNVELSMYKIRHKMKKDLQALVDKNFVHVRYGERDHFEVKKRDQNKAIDQ